MKESFGNIKIGELGPNKIHIILSNENQPVTGFKQFIISYDVFDVLTKILGGKVRTDLTYYPLSEKRYYKVKDFIKRNGETL